MNRSFQIPVKIPKTYAGILLSLALLLALTSVWGGCLFGERTASTLIGFLIALISAVLVMGFQVGKTELERQKRQKDLLRGVYVELLENLEYLEGLFADRKTRELNFIPPLSRTAWDMACVDGTIDPTDKFFYQLSHIYRTLTNFTYLSNQAVDTALRSPRPRSERDAVVDGLIKLLKQMHSSLVPLAEEVQKELARRVGISPAAVASLREQIRQRILRFRAEG